MFRQYSPKGFRHFLSDVPLLSYSICLFQAKITGRVVQFSAGSQSDCEESRGNADSVQKYARRLGVSQSSSLPTAGNGYNNELLAVKLHLGQTIKRSLKISKKVQILGSILVDLAN